MSTKIVRNTTANTISITDTGVSLAPGESFAIDARNYGEWAQSTVKNSYINSGDIVVNDGSRDLAPAVGLTFLTDNIAFKIQFESNPERINNFVSKNVQEAIEETQQSDIGRHQAVSFQSNGSTSNKWLQFFSSSDPSNSLPMVVFADSSIKACSYSNITDNTDIDFQIYKNGILYITIAVRNKRWAYWNETSLPLNSFVMGDRVSCFAQKVTGGTGVTPNSVILYINFQTTTNNHGSGGAQSGV